MAGSPFYVFPACPTQALGQHTNLHEGNATSLDPGETIDSLAIESLGIAEVSGDSSDYAVVNSKIEKQAGGQLTLSDGVQVVGTDHCHYPRY